MSITLLAPGAVARRLGLSVSRIVQFDQLGILPAMRDSAGRRLYDAEAVEEFARVREARKAGEHVADKTPAAAGAGR